MTFPPSPPKKRRRRWLIAAFVLVLVSTVSWWNWPRGDVRFVGKWAMTHNLRDKSNVSATNADQFVTITLSSSGRGLMVLKPDTPVVGAAHYEFLWEVTGNEFLMADSQRPGFAKLELLWYRQTGRPLGIAQLTSQTIANTSSKEFVLDRVDWQGRDVEWRMKVDGEPPTFCTRISE